MDIQPINLNNLDKSTWLTYRFDEIAKNISERVDPNNTDLKVYIGLEHIDSDSIHIKRTGTPDDVNGQKLRCYPGDVIFGRRRAYQRKAAIAKMDGFCSAHSLVLRANPDVIDPKLFPFFMHSDAFMHRAIDISVGSLSPTINWGTLKHQEFQLPLKDQQARLAELLWAMDEVVENSYIILSSVNQLLLSIRKDHFCSKSGNLKLLGDITTIRAGTGFPMQYQGAKDKGIMFFKVGDMNSEINLRILVDSEHTISLSDMKEIKGKLHEKGTVVFPKVGAAIATEKKRILGLDALIDNNVMGVTPNDKELLPPEYLLEVMNTISLQELSNAGTVPSINAQIVKNIAFYLPDKQDIYAYLSRVTELVNLEQNAKKALVSSKSLQKKLINQIF